MESELVENFKQLYCNLPGSDLSRLGEVYAQDLVFIDPVHKVEGLSEIEDYIAALCRDLHTCRFEFLDQLVADDSAYIKWNMHFQHARLSDRLICVRGVSHIQFNQKIYFHEDFYDLGAMVYEQLPVIGHLTRWLKNRLAN